MYNMLNVLMYVRALSSDPPTLKDLKRGLHLADRRSPIKTGGGSPYDGKFSVVHFWVPLFGCIIFLGGREMVGVLPARTARSRHVTLMTGVSIHVV